MDYSSYRPPSAQQQQPAYGAYPPYNAHVHPHPPHPPQSPHPSHHAQHAYGYAPPAPAAPADPFRTYYASRLRDLTFNSRPIIQDLSMTAMQQRDSGNWANMQAVVEEIEAAVLRAQVKLPMLYLIDSISKNVGAPYTTDLLRPIIPRLYVKTYREVDGVTKSKMEEMISLWKTSGPGRTDLYGPDVRMAVEREIFGSTGPTLNQPQRHVLPTREVVVQTLHSTLDAKQRESAGKPWDATLKHQIGVLQAIGELLNSSQVPPQDLQHIMEQLRSMAPTQPMPPTAHTPTYQSFTPTPVAPGPPAPALPPFPPQLGSNGNYRSTPPLMPPMPPTLGAPSHRVVTPMQGSSTPIPGQAPAPLQAPTPIPSGIPSNVADILRNLNASGLLSNPRTPETAPATLPAKTALDNYEEMVLSMNMRLDSLDLNRTNALPTSHLPQRCKQCGIRFPDGDVKMQAHLDWHFRRNKQKTESSGRGAHRRWLPRAEDWIVDIASNNEAGPSTSRPDAANSSGGAGANKLSAEQLARYAARKVRAPQDPVKAGKPCPVCKEVFKAELEDDEWVFRNAIEVGGVIYHATCRAEQMNARKNAKLLHPNGRLSGSPRITPQPGEAEVKVEQRQSPMKAIQSASNSTPSGQAGDNVDDVSTSVKRKAEDEQVEEEESKRVKVEPGLEEEEEENANGAEDDSAIAQQQEPADKSEQEDIGEDVKPDQIALQTETREEAMPVEAQNVDRSSEEVERIAAPASSDMSSAPSTAPAPAAPLSLTHQLQLLAGMFPTATPTAPVPSTPLEAPTAPVQSLTTTEPLDVDVDDEALYGSNA